MDPASHKRSSKKSPTIGHPVVSDQYPKRHCVVPFKSSSGSPFRRAVTCVALIRVRISYSRHAPSPPWNRSKRPTSVAKKP